jgi:hypothetical protein
MDYWQWNFYLTGIMVVLVLANLIRMNMFLTLMGKQIQVLFDEHQKEQQFKEGWVAMINENISKAQQKAHEKASSEVIREWDDA